MKNRSSRCYWKKREAKGAITKKERRKKRMFEETPEGTKVLRNMLTTAAEFPSQTTYNPLNLLKWSRSLKSITHTMLQYFTPEEEEEYRRIEDDAKRASSFRYTDTVRYLKYGYDSQFQLLSLLSQVYADKGILLETTEGITIVYDLFVKICDFPKLNQLNLLNIHHWYFLIRSMECMLRPYTNEPIARQFSILHRKIRKIAALYPSEDYTSNTIETLYEMIEVISRILEERNQLIPEDLTVSETSRRLKK
jgi:hypothetical protein